MHIVRQSTVPALDKAKKHRWEKSGDAFSFSELTVG
jgi:hypothetical protein